MTDEERDAVIEECARAVEAWKVKAGPNDAETVHAHNFALNDAATSIRALASAPAAATGGQWEALIDKLDGDSLDAICEVIGSPKLYNDGKSMMRKWFLDRLRAALPLPPDPAQGGRE